MRPSVSILVKPASSNCNLHCEYCFYHDESLNRSIKSFGLMQYQTIEAIIKKTLEYASNSCTFAFQGGEPTLAGLDFFKSVNDLEKKHNKKNLIINNALQTNGTLIDDKWASFFANNKYLIGVSLDGHESLHNLYRKDAQGNGTFARVMQGIEALKRNNVEFNVLSVVTAQTAKHIKDVYDFFIKNGLVYQQYIPCLDPIGHKQGLRRSSLTPQLYTRFLKNLFDVWYKDKEKGKFVYNRYFENLAGLLMGLVPESCDMNGVCSVQYAIEADGSVYPCDFYMLDGYCMGNINSDSMEKIDANRQKIGFIEKSANLPEQCMECQWRSLCRGGCSRNRMQSDSPDSGLNYFCESYKEFFPYVLMRMRKLLVRAQDA